MGAEKFKQIGVGVVVVGVGGVHIKCRGSFERSSTEFKVEPTVRLDYSLTLRLPRPPRRMNQL